MLATNWLQQLAFRLVALLILVPNLYGQDRGRPGLPAPLAPPPASFLPESESDSRSSSPWAVPEGMQIVDVPLQTLDGLEGELRIEGGAQSVSIFARDVDLRTVLAHLSEESGVNIVIAESVDARVTTTLSKVPLQSALDAILRINGLVWTMHDNIIFVTRPTAGSSQPLAASQPGQVIQVFDLHYTSSTEVLEVVQGLLSPSGKAFMHAVDKMSARQTRERIVVEDYPERVRAIAGYLACVDNPPKQVLIEAHVLQVTLDKGQRHGVNLAGLARIANGRVHVHAQGFANGDAEPGFMLGLESHDLDGMIEMLQSNSNVRTLAAPKVLVVNGQEARIQIGSKFGYFVTTTTQTSTLQSVDFLDIGVVLVVTPTITHDGQVLMMVQPKVSGGRINPETGLPEEDTTEAQTTVLLPDGKGMIIGGLIKEIDDRKKSWIPWLGERPIIGPLFSRSNQTSQRIEVILALTPHVVPYSSQVDGREQQSYYAATDVSGIVTSTAPVPMHSYEYEPYLIEEIYSERQPSPTISDLPPLPSQ